MDLFMNMSLPLLLILTVFFFLAFLELGTHIGRLTYRTKEQEDESALGTMVGSILGLLAFLLAFTFGLTSTRFDVRRQLMLEETNAISKVYLTADLVPSRERDAIKDLIRQYVENRLGLTVENLSERIVKAEEMHRLLWVQVKSLMSSEIDPDFRSSFIGYVADLINLHQSRKTVAIQYRIQPTIWCLLYFLSFLSMLAIGYQAGVSSKRRVWGMPILALAFALVMVVIADIDRPGEGLFRVSDAPLKDLQNLVHP